MFNVIAIRAWPYHTFSEILVGNCYRAQVGLVQGCCAAGAGLAHTGLYCLSAKSTIKYIGLYSLSAKSDVPCGSDLVPHLVRAFGRLFALVSERASKKNDATSP